MEFGGSGESNYLLTFRSVSSWKGQWKYCKHRVNGTDIDCFRWLKNVFMLATASAMAITRYLIQPHFKQTTLNIPLRCVYSRLVAQYQLSFPWHLSGEVRRRVCFPKQCCLSGDSRMMSLETWLYIWKWSKSRWPRLKWLLCACLCASVLSQTLRCRFVFGGYYGAHESHLLLFGAVGNFYRLSCWLRGH